MTNFLLIFVTVLLFLTIIAIVKKINWQLIDRANILFAASKTSRAIKESW